MKTKSRIKWFVRAADVERVRLQRVGPTIHELESFILADLASGRTASEIVCSGHQITLGDIERVRELDARLSGGFVVDAAGAGELRRILGLESINPEVSGGSAAFSLIVATTEGASKKMRPRPHGPPVRKIYPKAKEAFRGSC